MVKRQRICVEIVSAGLFQDPIVKYGYMRGTETANYVDKIQQRWLSYRGVKTPRQGFTQEPRKSNRQRSKYKL